MSERYHPNADISEDVQIAIASDELLDGKKDIYVHVCLADAITIHTNGPNVEYALLELIRRMGERIIALDPTFENWETRESDLANLENERDCLLKIIKHCDLADMKDDEVNKLLEDCKKGIFKMP